MRKIKITRKKNTSKAEALLAIKNFFMNSTLAKLKDIEGFKEAENNKNENNEIKDNNKESEK